MEDFVLAHRSYPSDLLLLRLSPPPQLLHNFSVYFRVEQLPEDHLLIVGLCPEQFHKFSLGDHSNLHKLTLRKPHDLLNLSVRLLLRILRPVRHDQRDRSALFFRPGSPL